ncbi:hypothetical protein O7599_16660 [Streptomyces sp. WMMC500]|uniref:hypothetical protein n=1 Tax=Streptomyces sp. WMMC500 TaxID=3015154 RepID=UPI00248AE7CB|nr:hypothetical protein [Streptomyces sp. WMMC500]WBB64044.1 hypothetical protein O7599_16660 [Streptomyces sp. WMMC500]
MTAGNHGAGTPPEDDDPFAHLYRPEGGAAPVPGPGEGAAPAPGVPRTSYTQVRAVGERTYGGQQAPQYVPQQQAYPYGQSSPSPHYAAPETYGGPPPQPPSFPPGDPGEGPRRGRGGGRNGLMLGAVAVVATVVIAIVAAVLFSGDGEESDVGGGDSESVAPSDQAGDGPKNGDDKPEKDPTDPPTEDGTKLSLAGGAVVGNDTNVSEDGSYVHGMETQGASATWEPEVSADGEYTLFVDYSVPGKDADLTLTINGEAAGRPLNMENFAKAGKDDWLAGWTRTYSWISLNEGANEIKLSCESGNKDCQTAISKVSLAEGQVTQP